MIGFTGMRSTLSDEDIDHYQRVVVALNETIRIMGEIDGVIEAHGGWPAAFQGAAGRTGEHGGLLKVAESSPPYGRGGPTGVSDDRD